MPAMNSAIRSLAITTLIARIILHPGSTGTGFRNTGTVKNNIVLRIVLASARIHHSDQSGVMIGSRIPWISVMDTDFKEVTYRANRSGVIGAAPAKTETAPELLQEEGATASFSAQGLGMIKKQEDAQDERESAEKQMYQEMLENAREAAKAQEKGFGDLAKALEIARRILDGDIVPLQDEEFHMEFNSQQKTIHVYTNGYTRKALPYCTFINLREYC